MRVTALSSAAWLCLSLAPAALQRDGRTLLAAGGAPECPDHQGIRRRRSAVAQSGSVRAWIDGSAERTGTRCRTSAEVHVDAGGAESTFPLPDADRQQFDIIDFSSDRSSILISSHLSGGDSAVFRDVQVARLTFASGEMRWRNIWDLFGWTECDATVEALGLARNGRVLVNARPTVASSHPRRNCVPAEHVYSVDLVASVVSDRPAGMGVEQYGETTAPEFQACKTDPDVIGSCFTVRGRLSAWNGNPTWRIWRIGTRRILGVKDFMMPELDLDDETFGDFTVCPFTKEQSGVMQMVCIESAAHLTGKRKRR